MCFCLSVSMCMCVYKPGLSSLGSLAGLLLEQPPGIHPPGHGNHIQYILAKEQEIVGQGNHRKEVVGEGIGKQTDGHIHQIEQGEDPCLDGNDEEQQKARVREQRGIAEEQAHVQIVHIRPSAEDHAVDIHHHNACQVEQVKAQGAPDVLHSPSDGIVAHTGDQHQEHVARVVGQRIGDEPPDLPMEDGLPVKHQKVVKQIVSGHLAHKVHNGSADDDIQHQILDALVAVFVAVKFKLPSQVFQIGSTPNQNPKASP